MDYCKKPDKTITVKVSGEDHDNWARLARISGMYKSDLMHELLKQGETRIVNKKYISGAVKDVQKIHTFMTRDCNETKAMFGRLEESIDNLPKDSDAKKLYLHVSYDLIEAFKVRNEILNQEIQRIQNDLMEKWHSGDRKEKK